MSVSLPAPLKHLGIFSFSLLSCRYCFTTLYFVLLGFGFCCPLLVFLILYFWAFLFGVVNLLYLSLMVLFLFFGKYDELGCQLC